MHSHLYPVDDRVEIDVNRLFSSSARPSLLLEKKKSIRVVHRPMRESETMAKKKKREKNMGPLHVDLYTEILYR